MKITRNVVTNLLDKIQFKYEIIEVKDYVEPSDKYSDTLVLIKTGGFNVICIRVFNFLIDSWHNGDKYYEVKGDMCFITQNGTLANDYITIDTIIDVDDDIEDSFMVRLLDDDDFTPDLETLILKGTISFKDKEIEML